MTGRRRFTGLIAPALAAGVLAACTPGPGTDPAGPPSTGTPAGSPSSSPDRTVTTITTGLAAPWSIAFYGETPLVSERDSGRILELGTDGTPREAGVIAGVAASGEGGLQGIAVRDGSLYAYYTAGSENRIERFELTGAPGALGLGAGETLLADIPAARFHNGGRIAFGPDGMLYATVGDAGDRGSAQERAALTGKILRMTPDGRAPADNPFPGSLVYSYGHRNPQGLAWSADGTLYASEFGQDTWDELNVIEPGGNYGWPEVEGIAGRDGFRDPVQQWRPADASPSGMAVQDGSIYLANLRGGRLRQIPLDDPATSTEHLAGEYGRLRDVTVAPDGSLWVLTNNTDGRGNPAPGDDRILRVEPGT
ncbi:PQQ-dependent sugar dehydrogenase [Nocardia sp. CA-290969]|uniref:PQQ-dependent sugar dehydrogenase n=1 Tax=Nocardia sp. CA-290969 TaxID=3239986 RepID=UPI003D90EB01